MFHQFIIKIFHLNVLIQIVQKNIQIIPNYKHILEHIKELNHLYAKYVERDLMKMVI